MITNYSRIARERRRPLVYFISDEKDSRPEGLQDHRYAGPLLREGLVRRGPCRWCESSGGRWNRMFHRHFCDERILARSSRARGSCQRVLYARYGSTESSMHTAAKSSVDTSKNTERGEELQCSLWKSLFVLHFAAGGMFYRLERDTSVQQAKRIETSAFAHSSKKDQILED